MFDPSSRYFAIPTTTLSVADAGDRTREIRFIKRRIIPASETMTMLVEHTVTQGERLDNVTARYLGDPAQFWRVCDANNVMQPEELEETGRVVKIALPNL
ncbi:MAG TPA: LysM domain-containing protein [Blastocatellia bacterium]|nr:LysM domain-containing protein [Blastocatellia bacterium]